MDTVKHILSNTPTENGYPPNGHSSPVTSFIDYPQLVQKLPVAIYACDADGFITMYNNEAVRLWGRAPEKGKDVWCGSWKIFTPEGVPLPLSECPMAIALREQREVLGQEILIERPDGIRLSVLPHPQPFYDSNGNLAGAFNTLVDITHQKYIYQVLLDKNIELEQFAYVASHDLQEPLNTINSFISFLEKEHDFNEEVTQCFGYIRESSSRLIQLITGLLLHSRIGKQGETARIDLNQVVNDVLADMKVSIETKNAKVQVNGELPVVQAYPIEMRQLFQNLISNGLKFQRRDVQPIIQITASKNSNQWHFTIEDNGIGIEEKFLDRIFVLFQRLHTSNEYEGTGIGLANCKKIVDLHRGKIWVDSEYGKGSKFHFTISDKV